MIIYTEINSNMLRYNSLSSIFNESNQTLKKINEIDRISGEKIVLFAIKNPDLIMSSYYVRETSKYDNPEMLKQLIISLKTCQNKGFIANALNVILEYNDNAFNKEILQVIDNRKNEFDQLFINELSQIFKQNNIEWN